MKKTFLSLAAILIALILGSCSKTDLGTNDTQSEALSNPKGSNITVNANPAIVWRGSYTSNNMTGDALWVMDANGGNPTMVYFPSITSGKSKQLIGFSNPHWSPDGGSICITLFNTLYKMNISVVRGVPTVSNLTKLLDTATYHAYVFENYWSFGSNNEIICIARISTDGSNKILAVPANGGSPTTIYSASSDYIIRYLTVSPDGSKIAFGIVEKSTSNRYIKVIDRSNGSELYSIQTNSILSGFGQLDWARTSSSNKIALYATPYGSTVPCIYTLDVTDATTLTQVKTYGRAPSWSPDDTKLVYSVEQSSPWYLNTINLSGGTVTNLKADYATEMQWKK